MNILFLIIAAIIGFIVSQTVNLWWWHNRQKPQIEADHARAIHIERGKAYANGKADGFKEGLDATERGVAYKNGYNIGHKEGFERALKESYNNLTTTQEIRYG
jgi:flagellar biosynthesis/type III secretory pathway protein FliH